jgi:hypothetical protein
MTTFNIQNIITSKSKFFFNLIYLTIPFLSLIINGNVGYFLTSIKNISLETSLIFLFNFIVSIPFIFLFLRIFANIKEISNNEIKYLDSVNKIILPLLLTVIVYKAYILFDAVDNHNPDTLRQLIFPSSEGESLFFNNQTQYFIYSCFSNFVFVFSLLIFFFNRKFKWLLFLLVILDKVTNLERGFYISLFYCLFFIIQNLQDVERKRKLKRSIIVIFILAILQFTYVSSLRSINDSPIANLTKNLLISPRLFEYFLNNREMEGFYIYGYNTFSSPIFPIVKKSIPSLSRNIEYSRFTIFHDDFHPIEIFKNEKNYENAYVTGVFSSFRDFGIIGIVIQWIVFLFFSIVLLAICKSKNIIKAFILISLSLFSITFIITNYLTFNLFYSSAYMLLIFGFLYKLKNAIIFSFKINNLGKK